MSLSFPEDCLFLILYKHTMYTDVMLRFLRKKKRRYNINIDFKKDESEF